jgi:thiol:disulfide interchange protein DsbD
VRGIGIVLAAAFATTAFPGFPSENAGQVRARLISDASRLVPGGTIHVGVLFEIEPEWHIYWKNPGDAGLATSVDLELPEGFVAGPLAWPVPERFLQSGELVGYGYRGSVLLASEVFVPERLPVGPVAIGATASWLACRERCVLGEALLEGRLPDPAASAPEARSAFEAWRGALPTPAGSPEIPFEFSVVGGPDADARTGSLSIWLQWPESPGRVEWFPQGGDALRASPYTLATRGRLTRIDAALRLLGNGGRWPEVLPALIVVEDSGARHGYEMRIPLPGRSEAVASTSTVQ